MNYFFNILTNIVLPVFFQILIGFFVHKLIKFNIKTLVNLQFYIVIPALLFVKFYDSDIDFSLISSIALYSLLLFSILTFLSILTSKLFKIKKDNSKIVTNAVIYANVGNFTLPVIVLLFNNPLATSVQVILIFMQNILLNTVGIATVSGHVKIKDSIKEIAKLPFLYAIIISVVFKVFHITLYNPAYIALESISKGFVSIALITLGAQLSETKFSFKNREIIIANTLKLLVSPFIALVLIKLIGFPEIVSKVLLISSAAPTAVNTVLMSIKYGKSPDLAAKTVFSSTLISSITITFVIYIINVVLF